MFNTGAIFRNSDAFGVDHVYLTGYTATPPRVEISKTALGADNTVDWSHHKDVIELIARLKEEGKRVLAFESRPECSSIDSVDTSGDIVAVFGNEPEGIPQEVIDVCDECVYIPMKGEKTSLNVSVASGVALFALRQE